MGMPLQWTAEMARALPDDGKRYEVLDGELFVSASPRAPHQRALRALYDRLSAYVKGAGVGEVFWSPADIEFSPRRLLQPDLFVAPFINGRPAAEWSQIRSLILAVEALSPSTAYADRHRKRTIYMSEDVGEYWILDADARVVERWRKGEARPDILDEALLWQPTEAIPPLTVDLPLFFREAHGE